MKHPFLPALTPMLAFPNTRDAIDFYTRAFGATEIMKLVDPAGSIVHAEMKIGEAIIMLADEHPKFNRSPQTLNGTSVILNLYVDNVDAFIDRAARAGAELLIRAEDQFYGARAGRVRDPFGYVWIVSTHIEDISTEQMQRRFDAMMKGPPHVQG